MLRARLSRCTWLGAGGAALAFLLGLGLLGSNYRAAKTLRQASYDWLFDLSPFQHSAAELRDVLIIYMDEPSHLELRQPFTQPWDRALHAQLLDRLRADGARLVLFDVLFSEPGPAAAADAALALALRAHGKVVLAANLASTSPLASAREVPVETVLTPPHAPFREAAAAWGFAQLQLDEDFTIREHLHGLAGQLYVSLTWAAASVLGLDLARTPDQRLEERWINYYGGPDSVPNLSYRYAREMPAGYFRDKVVFIGARPGAGLIRERRDEFRSPLRSWYAPQQFLPAAEIHATMLLNLIRGDWLRRLPPWAEWAGLLGVALLFGLGLTRVEARVATLLAVLGVLGLTALALAAFWFGRVWWPWLIAAGVQVPAAWLWALSHKSLDWYVERRRLLREQRRAELQIHEQAALLDKARDAIIVHDLEWRVTYWNQSAERLYGWTAAEVRAVSLVETLGKPQVAKLLEARQQALERGEWTGPLEQTAKDGHALTVESRWTLVRDEQGQPRGVLVINTDVTEKKRLEAQFLRAQRMESIGALTGGIAHDLNNLLVPIMMAIEELETQPLDDHARRAVGLAANAADRGASLVKQVLAYARGHVGERAVLQVGRLVSEMENLARQTFPKSIKVRSRVAPDLPPVWGDATQVHQVLLNLCINARDAMPRGGELVVEADHRRLSAAEAERHGGIPPGLYVTLLVRDTGTGIPPEIRGRIFEPFFTTKEEGKGTGLGLSTTLTIVKSHRGAMDAESEVGRGTVFTVFLPAAEITVAAAHVVAPPAPPRGQGEVILVVDDEPVVRMQAQNALCDAGYRVLTAVHGKEAIGIMLHEGTRVAVAVVDLMMPVMDGLAALRILRNMKPELPCVATSALVQPDKLRAEFGPHEVEFLLKPFTAARLVAAVHRALRAGPSAGCDEDPHAIARPADESASAARG